MASDMTKMFNIIFMILLSNYNLLQSVYSEQLAPCYFIFGDSLVDNGNNNDRNTFAKANYPPYGIDYPTGPTGRFTNGRNVADFIAELLGFSDHIPPFATASGNATINGVNYASGGAGILDDTGKQLGDLISLNAQLQNHQTTLQSLTNILGNADAAQKHLGQCIYTVWMGSNDYANNYIIPGRRYQSSKLYNPEQFADLLIDQYSRQMRSLYTYGARKVALLGLFDIGCVPAALRSTGTSLCIETTNDAAKLFNTKLKSLVDVLNKDLIGAKFTYVDTYGIRASDPATNGFKYSNVPWCIVSFSGMCVLQGATPIPRTDFAYFDAFHPTEAAAAVIAKRAFTAQSPSDVYPMDIQHLAQAQ